MRGTILRKKIIYVDNAATTKISDSCFQAMLPYLKTEYGNPSSIYSIAHNAKFAIENARKKIAETLNASPEEIYFTSCATESNNWAIKCAATLLKKEGKTHIITSKIEHPSVLNCCKSLEKEGFKITYVPVNNEGIVNPKDIENAIKEKTALVSIMWVNNEIGTIQPINKIAKICSAKKVLFHTDAVQAVGHVKISLKDEKINMLSISGHKINAPKGVGLLYIKKGTKINSFLNGGGQEKNLRAGTENVAFIVGLAKALEEITQNITQKENKIKILRDFLLMELEKNITKLRVNGSLEKRVASNLNVSFEGIEGESLLLLLDSYGICASSGSACTSNSLNPSHVLLAIGLPAEVAHGSLRISLNENNTMEEIKEIVKATISSVEKLRQISPIWN